jgi:ABC-type amino acid transport substrate-binding protein
VAIVLISAMLASHASANPYLAGGAQWTPFAYTDEKGHLAGIAVDIARRVMQLANIDMTFNTYPVNRLQSMLQKGEIDVNFADALQWNDPDELNRYAFSEPYAVVKEHLYFLADNPSRGLPAEQLNGLIIGMVRGYTYKVLDPAFDSKRLIKLETSQDEALLKLLLNKRVSAVAMVDDTFDLLLARNHLDARRFRQGAELTEAPLVFKLQPQYAQWLPRINQAIKTLRDSGELDRIRRNYLPTNHRMVCNSAVQAC